MQWIRGTHVKLGEMLIEVPRAVILAMDKQSAHTDHLGSRRHPPQGIDDQPLAQTRALGGKVNAKASQDHNWLAVAARTLG